MMEEKIIGMLAKQFRVETSAINGNTNIVDDLGADSLEIVDMLMAVEENFGVTISDEEVLTLHTVRDVAELIESKL